MTKKHSRRDRIRQIERNTATRTPGDVREARRVFEKELSRRQQMDLVRELVETRAAELCRAYMNVIDVTYGYKTKAAPKTGRQRILRRPCVTFVVKRKWQGSEQAAGDQSLPSHLFAYCTVRDERLLCAVPTDVDDAAEYVAIRLQAKPRNIDVAPEGVGLKGEGVVACAVERSNKPSVFAIGCRHVLSLSEGLHPRDVAGSPVRRDGAAKDLGATSKVMGSLRNAPLPSLDAQLAKVTETGELALALDGVRFFAIASASQVPGEFDDYWILTPHGPVYAKYRKYLSPSFSIDYGRPGIENVIHRNLVQSVAHSQTFDGDSGAPVASGRNGGTLIGMHIGITGRPKNSNNVYSMMIPAWDLIQPGNYNGASSTESWKIYNP